MLQHRSDIRVLAVEPAKHDSVVFGMALGENQVAKALPVRAREPAILLEPSVRVVVQHDGPLIGVVAGRVSVRPDVQEIARAVARRHIRKIRARPLQRLRLEFVDILLRHIGSELVPLHVEFRGRQQFTELVALIPGLRFLDLVHQRLWDRLPRLVVHRIMLEDLRIKGPVLVELRRELDKIARHAGSGERLVLLVREQAMQRVAEFVEHGRHVIET